MGIYAILFALIFMVVLAGWIIWNLLTSYIFWFILLVCVLVWYMQQ